MQLCKPLYDTTPIMHPNTPKEKEIMQQVFEREARREKNLEIAKKLANDEKVKG